MAALAFWAAHDPQVRFPKLALRNSVPHFRQFLFFLGFVDFIKEKKY
jgi:hypothetical protein